MIPTSVGFVEATRAPTFSLPSKMQDMGFSIQRVNYREGFDFKAGAQKLNSYIQEKKPKHIPDFPASTT